MEENIINSVRGRQVLYDHSHPKHKDGTTVDNNWREIGQQCDMSGELVFLLFSYLLSINYNIHPMLTRMNK